MPLSREPWPGGYRPVISVACDGSVIGAAAYARSNGDAAPRKPVERRRLRARVSVGADVIGPQRIDGDQEQIARRRLTARTLHARAQFAVQRPKRRWPQGQTA